MWTVIKAPVNQMKSDHLNRNTIGGFCGNTGGISLCQQTPPVPFDICKDRSFVVVSMWTPLLDIETTGRVSCQTSAVCRLPEIQTPCQDDKCQKRHVFIKILCYCHSKGRGSVGVA